MSAPLRAVTKAPVSAGDPAGVTIPRGLAVEVWTNGRGWLRVEAIGMQKGRVLLRYDPKYGFAPSHDSFTAAPETLRQALRVLEQETSASGR